MNNDFELIEVPINLRETSYLIRALELLNQKRYKEAICLIEEFSDKEKATKLVETFVDSLI